ncbi:MAG: SpoIID/LytB domain-containing protein [Acidimicrobiia bacterium]
MTTWQPPTGRAADPPRRRRGPRLVAALLLVAGVVAPGVAAAPPAAAASPSLTLTGHGWGHGRGMGQYGSYGYAVDHGWRHTQILDHFYGNTQMGSLGDVAIQVDLNAWIGRRLLVTSDQAFAVGTVPMGAGTLAEVFKDTDGVWKVQTWYRTDPCGKSVDSYGPYEVGTPQVVLSEASGDDLARMLSVCESAGRRAYRGTLGMAEYGGATHVVNELPIDQYLRGVVPRESPASWGDAGGVDPGTGLPRGMQSLMAQAVAARSYAWAEDRPGPWRTCDTASCQVYSGAGLNGTRLEDHRTDQAVALTAGEVRVRNGTVMRTEFSSSTGGWTAGGTFPAVQDLGDVRSPRHDWTTTVSGAAIEAAYPTIGSYTGFEVTQRNGLGQDGGRVLQVRVWGTTRSVVDTGDNFRRKLNLFSDWYSPVGPSQLVWYGRQAPGAGQPELTVPFGGPSALPLGCDLAGDGTARDGVTIYDGDTFYARATPSGGAPEVVARYGAPGYVPVCGDWDGDGVDGIGVYVAGIWYLRQTATPGPPDVAVYYGYAGAIPVVGDWDGDGVDGIGVYDGGAWYLRQTATPGAPQVTVSYGMPGYVPVVGDWDGVGGDGIGVYVDGAWYLRQTSSPGAAQVTFAYGAKGMRPVVGNWDGTGGDGIAVTAPG